MDWKTKQIGGNHYKSHAIQPLEYVIANGLDFCEGSVIKYVTRWKEKGGVEDLKKAIHYLEVLIAQQSEVVPRQPVPGEYDANTEGCKQA